MRGHGRQQKTNPASPRSNKRLTCGNRRQYRRSPRLSQEDNGVRQASKSLISLCAKQNKPFLEWDYHDAEYVKLLPARYAGGAILRNTIPHQVSFAKN